MAAASKVLVIAGSAREGAFSVKLAKVAAAALAAAGAETTQLDLRALGLPIYDGDLEAAHGVPDGARTLRDALLAHDAMLLVTPEYNGFPTPLVINAFDWLSRLKPEGSAPAGLGASAGKPCALLSSSPGPLGGLRSLNLMRQFLGLTIGMLIVPQQFALVRAGEAFGPDGALLDAKAQQSVDGVAAALLRLSNALRKA
ncbi:NADPH-dependent FMN reductase [Rivibacter subsaxonicus]|uniref:NAD(P)H-dependent FMN reductase n=1 Tax=Rivibacter subsaxonicus TaxID=457575 RepID=A0A4Q7W214_9BURK|nr:NAD(P)H-dependent oxidoreductase [Rivibacter subsaxonicus]RZU02599.1 NAD(P)H-dependent FMN reductase [Rivibacter subsaxonicus]